MPRPIRRVGVAIAFFKSEGNELTGHIVEGDGSVVHLRAIAGVLV